MKCKTCKKSFTPKYREPWCSDPECKEKYLDSDHAKKYLKAIATKAKKQVKQQDREKMNAMKENIQKKSDFEKVLETAINALVKKIDYGHQCISCDHKRHSLALPHAGHYHSVGAQKYLRYHLVNIWLQCKKCNVDSSGNPIPYLRNIEAIYGKQVKEYMEYDLIRASQPLKLSNQEYKELAAKVRMINKRLPEEVVYTNEQRLSLRRAINQEIGIYHF